MKLLDPTWIRDNVDYSFGDESGMGIGGYMKPAHMGNQEFMDKYRVHRAINITPMTLFIDNMRLYRRPNYRYTAVEQHNPVWQAIRDNKVRQFAAEDLLRMCAQLHDVNFIIFTGFEDMAIDEGIWQALPANVLAVYACNCMSHGDRVYPIPYGLQRKMSWNDMRQSVISSLIDTVVEPQRLLYLNFNIGNHPTRPQLVNRFIQEPWTTVHNPGMGLVDEQASRQYYGTIKDHKFMLCPSGNADGCECHRDIEVLYMRRVPVVTDTEYHHIIFDQLKAPVLYVDDLLNVTEQLLIDNDYLYQQMQIYDMSNLDIELLYYKWIDQCKSVTVNSL